jgi:hypothetical protein
MDKRNVAVALTNEALSGASIKVDARHFNLFTLTQIASALRQHATLTVINGALLTPLERACIATTTSTQVDFGSAGS